MIALALLVVSAADPLPPGAVLRLGDPRFRAAGEVRHSIALDPTAAVSISPMIPGPDAVVAKYAKKPGCCQWVTFGSISRR